MGFFELLWARLYLLKPRSLDGRPAKPMAYSIETIARFERNHGPSPESAYRRGCAHRALGRREDERGAFAEVGRLARQSARYQRGEAAKWARLALLARLR